jgi:hypothetical protein
MSYGGINLGGGFNGISPVQTINSLRNHEIVLNRKEVRNSWNQNTLPIQKNESGESFRRVSTPFRAVMNMDDYLGRRNYICGGPTLSQVGSLPGLARLVRTPANSCDTTGIAGANCNPRFVADSSDYIRFRKMSTVNNTYNDNKMGGDQHNGGQSRYMFTVHHH